MNDGERIFNHALSLVEKGVTYLCPYSGRVPGILFVTNYRLYFQGEEVRCFSVLYLLYGYQIISCFISCFANNIGLLRFDLLI